MPEVVIEARNLGKKYQIGSLQSGRITAKEFAANLVLEPYRRLRSSLEGQLPTDAQREFWALRDVSFEIYQGETVGIIGVNGSGKSTLLRLISSITHPSEGEICTRGRVSSLLEIGSGFNPELTGRDNIYINGIILGMTRVEIDRKFDSILDFAAIHEFIDTPLKRYSTGMMARLAFSVAVHIEPEILIIDEVLAVGDWAFIQKSIAKVRSIARSGATVIIVSHMMSFITDLCDRVLWLEKGKVVCMGPVAEVTKDYLDTILPNEAQARERVEGKQLTDQQAEEALIAAQRAEAERVARQARREAQIGAIVHQVLREYDGEALLLVDEAGTVLFGNTLYYGLMRGPAPVGQPAARLHEAIDQAARDGLASATPQIARLNLTLHDEPVNVRVEVVGEGPVLAESETRLALVRLQPDRPRAEFAADPAKKIQMRQVDLVEGTAPDGGRTLDLQCTYEVRAAEMTPFRLGVDVANNRRVSVFYSNDSFLIDERKRTIGTHTVRVRIPVDLLAPGFYSVWFTFGDGQTIEDDPGFALTFLNNPDHVPDARSAKWPSVLYMPRQWAYVEVP